MYCNLIRTRHKLQPPSGSVIIISFNRVIVLGYSILCSLSCSCVHLLHICIIEPVKTYLNEIYISKEPCRDTSVCSLQLMNFLFSPARRGLRSSKNWGEEKRGKLSKKCWASVNITPKMKFSFVFFLLLGMLGRRDAIFDYRLFFNAYNDTLIQNICFQISLI